VPVIPGWIVQWYVNVPAPVNVWLNEAPGAMRPESQLLLVDVCVVLSLLCHVTVVPTATLTGFGENADVVMVDAPLTIVTVVPFAGVGVGVVVMGVLLFAQPASMRIRVSNPNSRLGISRSLQSGGAQRRCRMAIRHFGTSFRDDLNTLDLRIAAAGFLLS